MSIARLSTKFALLFLALSFLIAPTAFAQEGSISGLVTDGRLGNPITGALISVEALNRRVFTNEEGRYLLSNMPVGTHSVRVAFIGYTIIARDVAVTAGQTATADFTLEASALQLDAIIVTAQQIERQARELAYSVSSISGDDITRARETNFVTALAGRTPGVEVTTQSGNLGASSRIVIRGVSSLSGDNQPLFVVDGVPISNSNIVAGTSQDRLTGAIDVGNRGADLNADDIENVTILRGAAAAALYGQRAKDGVVLITTKKGTAARGQTVTASSSLRVSSPLLLPEFQNEFAQGSGGVYSPTSLNGWGPRIVGQEVENIRGEMVSLQPFEDNVKDFYDQALLSINSFAFSSADEQADFRLGFTYADESGIIPNSNQSRTSVNLNSGYRVRDNVQARLSGFYSNTDSKGRAVAGGNDPNVLTAIVNTLPRTFDIDDLRNYKDEQGNQRPIDTFNNNPYWVVNENVFTSDVERVFGNATIGYDPLSWLTFTGRTGIDFYTETRRNINAVGTIGREDGLFTLDVLRERQLNIDLLGEFRRVLNPELDFRGVVGFNANGRELQIQRNRAADLTVPGLYNFGNAQSNNPANSSQERHLYGVFGDVTLGYRDYAFLNVTGRNDWSSTLPKENNSFFYPSVNLSVVMTDALDVQSDVLAFAKLRANYAKVGSDEAPYQLDFRFFPVEEVFGQFGTNNTFPYNGLTSFEATATIPPADLKPQSKTALELGGEFQFYNGRAWIDLTYYDERIEDQIISIPIPQSTGFSFNRTNIGEVSNKGIEAQLNVNPIRNDLFNWNVLLNFTRNRNKVESLAPGVEELVIASGFNALQIKAEPGESFGIYGPGWLRDSISGQVVIDSLTGLRRFTEDAIRLGDVDPDFRLSLNNSFGVGRFNVGFLVDWRKGGQIFSQTVGQLRRLGLAEETAVNREGSFIDEGVIVQPDGTTRPNDVPVQTMQGFWQRYAASTIHEGNVFDADNVRLREVRADFNVPADWLEGTPVAGLTIGFEARNLFLLYKRVPHIDPETGLFGSASNGQGIEWNVLPTTRSFGINLQARF